MQTVKVALIGAGWVAQRHLEVIRAMDGLEPVGILSRTKAKAEAVAGPFQIPFCADNIDQLVRQTRPDALLVLVNEDQMHDVVTKVLPYRLPLLIEKPAGRTPAENQDLAEQARRFQAPTMVGFNRRFYSIFHKGLQVIRDHGALLGVAVEGHERMWRIREGKHFSEEIMADWIFANSTHTIDLLRFFGGEPRTCSAVAQRRFQEARGDQFAAVMEMDSGAIGQYHAHWYSPGGWRVVLYGDGVTVEFKPLESGRWTGKDFQTHEIEPDEVDRQFKPGFYHQMAAFGQMVRDGQLSWPALDLAGAYETMKLAERLSLAPPQG